MCLGNTVAFKTVKKWLPFRRAHIEPMRGTPQDSREYCSKADANFLEFGSCPTKGTKLLEAAVTAVRGGASLRELANRDDLHARAVVVHGRGLGTLSNLTTSSRDPSRPPKVYWLHGPTGTGKTRCSFELGQRYGDVCLIASPTLQWFEPYDRQPVVIFDDFRAKGVSFNFLLRVLDRYPLQVPLKGAFANWVPEVIFITTPRAPSETFEVRQQHKPEDIQQLLRRITRVVDFTNDDDVVSFKEQFISICPVQTSQASLPDAQGGRRVGGENGNQGGGGSPPSQLATLVGSGGDGTSRRNESSRGSSRADMVESARIIASLWSASSDDSSVGDGVGGTPSNTLGTQWDSDLCDSDESCLSETF